MKTYFLLNAILVIALAAQHSNAQFNIKLPKIPKVSKPADPPRSTPQTPRDDRPAADAGVSRSNGTTGSASAHRAVIKQPVPTNVPVLMKDTFAIDAKTNSVNYFSKWVPQVQFDLFYDNSVRLRYVAEWYKPDGSLWFSEPLEQYSQQNEDKGSITLRSPDSSEVFKANAINTVGTYGVKVKNSKTDQTVFEGKFKVNKTQNPEDRSQKNYSIFYVDHDWLMNLGYAGYNLTDWTTITENYPSVMVWLKGNLDHSELEAVLFHDGKQIATTDKGGAISTLQERGGSCYAVRDVCQFHLWKFRWDNFLLHDQDFVKVKYPNAFFAADISGEFTVKVFYKGEQIREAKFTLAADGSPVRDALSDGIYSTISLMPVRAMGNAEKWVPNTWKTNLFYGNPVNGFSVQ